MSNFNDFRLKTIANHPEELYGLADGLLPEMAVATDFELGDTPTVEVLRNFIGHIGPAKTLQDNIELVQERLSTKSDAITLASDWVDRSGALKSYSGNGRSLVGDTFSLPHRAIEHTIFNTAVGRWQVRRANQVIAIKESGTRVGDVAIFAGNRVMNENEHSVVAQLAQSNGSAPTEAEFAKSYVASLLKFNSINADVIEVDSSNGDEIFTEGLRKHPYLLNGVVLAVGNAPSSIQVAGQFRKAARALNQEFDTTGTQLYMSGDSIEVARHGEGAETHQNPFTALGQIARNALVLYEQALSL